MKLALDFCLLLSLVQNSKCDNPPKLEQEEIPFSIPDFTKKNIEIITDKVYQSIKQNPSTSTILALYMAILRCNLNTDLMGTLYKSIKETRIRSKSKKEISHLADELIEYLQTREKESEL